MIILRLLENTHNTSPQAIYPGLLATSESQQLNLGDTPQVVVCLTKMEWWATLLLLLRTRDRGPRPIGLKIAPTKLSVVSINK